MTVTVNACNWSWQSRTLKITQLSFLWLFEAAPCDVEGVLTALDEFGEVRVPSKLLSTFVLRDAKRFVTFSKDSLWRRFAFHKACWETKFTQYTDTSIINVHAYSTNIYNHISSTICCIHPPTEQNPFCQSP